MKINSNTAVFLSASSRPGNFGTTIYNELFARYRLNNVYISRAVTHAGKLIEAIRELDIRGCSISMPLKNQVIPFLDSISNDAASINSVNTITNVNNCLTGHNTDAYGFAKSIENVQFKAVLIYGTGSVVDSIIHELKKSNVKIFLDGRNRQKLIEKSKTLNVNVYNNEEIQLFINATPLSLEPIPEEVIQKVKGAQTVLDLVVKTDTYLKQTAEKNEINFVSGFEMYKHQFVKQFELYTNIMIEVNEVEQVAKENYLI